MLWVVFICVVVFLCVMVGVFLPKRDVLFADLRDILLLTKPYLQQGDSVHLSSSLAVDIYRRHQQFPTGYVYDVEVVGSVDLDGYHEVELDWNASSRLRTISEGFISAFDARLNTLEFVLRKGEDVPYQLFCKKEYRVVRDTG
jgi:hypothetical protein